MILGVDRIRELIKQGVEVEDNAGQVSRKPLIEHLSEAQFDKMEGTTVDLRLGEIFKLKGGAELLVASRITPPIELILSRSSQNHIYTLAPEELVLAQTIEWVNLPSSLLGDVRTRTTLFRCGLYLKTSYVSPNYQGVLTFALRNFSAYPVKIELGFRIACISFMEISGASAPYLGVWQGKRASTNGQPERPF